MMEFINLNYGGLFTNVGLRTEFRPMSHLSVFRRTDS